MLKLYVTYHVFTSMSRIIFDYKGSVSDFEKLDLDAILEDNSGGSNPAFLFVNLFYHQPFVTSITKTSKPGLLLFLSSGAG